MSLTTYGLISYKAVKNELGVNPSSFSLKSAELGNYVALNDCSTYKPNKVAKFSLSEWYGYNHTQTCVSNPPSFPKKMENVISFIETNDGKILATGTSIYLYNENVQYIKNGLMKLDVDTLRQDLSFTGIYYGEGFYGAPVNVALEEQDGSLIVAGQFNGNPNQFGYLERFPNSILKLMSSGAINQYENFNHNHPYGIYDWKFNYVGGIVYEYIRQASPVYAINKSLSTGKITIGGTFHRISSTIVENICRINADGTIDSAFSDNCKITQRDTDLLGEIAGFSETNQGLYIVGKFSPQTGGSGGPIFHNIIRVNQDGTTDFGFNPNGGSFVDTTVNHGTELNPRYGKLSDANLNAIKIRSDSTIIVVGYFKEYLRGAVVVGTPSSILALNTDGTIANTFNGGLNNEVHCLDIDNSNKMIAGGVFVTSYNNIKGIIRYNSDYSVDSTFMNNIGVGPQRTNPTNYVEIKIIKILSSGKILVYGTFDSWNGNTNMQNIALLNNDGTLAWS